jgi:hypothetical protein
MLLFCAFSTVLAYSMAIGTVSSDTAMLSLTASDSFFTQILAGIFQR